MFWRKKFKFDEEKKAVTLENGDWISYGLSEKDGKVILINNPNPNEGVFYQSDTLVQRVAQIITDVIDKPREKIRVLDLGCFEGRISLELAMQGMQVVGVEGRKEGYTKATFAAKALRLSNVRFLQADVRSLSAQNLGKFDVVLCLGILYHLEAPAVIQFLEDVFKLSTKMAIIDTHFSLKEQDSFEYKGRVYKGRTVEEFKKTESVSERSRRPEAALDNETSFWMTWPSISNALNHAGFSSVYECYLPTIKGLRNISDRLTLVALKGKGGVSIKTDIIPEDEKRPMMYHFLNYPWKDSADK